MNTALTIAAALAGGGWLGYRLGQADERIRNIINDPFAGEDPWKHSPTL
jgi:hypothetical protein